MARMVLARFRNPAGQPAESSKSSLWFGWTMALTATLAFSVAPPITKWAISAGMNPTTLLMLRLVITTTLLGGTIMLTAAERVRIDRRGLLICTTAGFCNGFGMVAFFWALARLEASVTSMIFSLSPLAVLGLLALRGEKFTYRQIVRLAVGLSGVYLLIGPGSALKGGIDWLGVALVFVTIFVSAIHLVLIQWFLQRYDARTVTLYTVATMTLVSIGFWLSQGTEWHDPGWPVWLIVLVLAVISTYLSRLALFAGVRHLGSGQMALLLPLETLLTVTWSVLFLHEWLTLWQWIGGLLILLSALLAVQRLRWTRKRTRWRVWWRP